MKTGRDTLLPFASELEDELQLYSPFLELAG